MVEPRTAGASALSIAVQINLTRNSILHTVSYWARVLQWMSEDESRWRAGAAGEQHVAQVLADMVETGWTILADRRWPGTRRANIDLLLAGPGGVFVIDAKRWSDVRISGGVLWHGGAREDEALEKIAAQAAAVQTLLAEEGLAPAEVMALLVLDRLDVPVTRIGTVHVLGERELVRLLTRRARRLTGEQVAQIGDALDRGCPPMPAPPAPASPAPAIQPALFEVEEIVQILEDAVAAAPIETWMTWLHPTQAKLAKRSWAGPARIRGAAGTGKTVVALHRARHLAAHGRRVLFTSYVGTLPPVFRSLFARLAPDLADDVSFASVHQVAVRLLRSTGADVTVDYAALDDCFARAWSAVRRRSPLADLGVPPNYWRDEIAHVIKGRGITDPADYASLRRVGRRTALQPGHRAAVWELFEQYERRRIDRDLTDWDDVLLAALALLDSQALPSPWDAVIVDEVQDLTCTGLRLLHRLGGDAPDGLLMVGDGRQALFPGGFTLAEAGVSVIGRSTVLDRNYRNGATILRYALAAAGTDHLDDLDDDPDQPTAVHAVHAARAGGTVVREEAPDAVSQHRALVRHLEDLRARGARFGDVALLVTSNAAARHWRRELTDAGIPAMLLAEYDGTQQDAVKVGTFERSKALEFTHVLIPDSDTFPGPPHPHESEDAYAERRDQERKRLHVGHTRARDGLWLGVTGGRVQAPSFSSRDSLPTASSVRRKTGCSPASATNAATSSAACASKNGAVTRT
ncbi:MAG: hypothetical protein QG622_3170 [Actinomycetota bacterium]|nr:hypothetical protein [Actinomycetota bacterium]